jgi:hypothetical protein
MRSKKQRGTTTTTDDEVPENTTSQPRRSFFPRPTLANRIVPLDDNTPYENNGNDPQNNTDDDDTTTNNGKDYNNKSTKSRSSFKGSEMDRTSIASSFRSRNDDNDNNDNDIPDMSKSGKEQSLRDQRAAARNGHHDELQEVMKDNLDLMFDIVMRIRDDEDFARNIYRDCPRLQHLLDQHPDLRPLFEDPNLVRINFEKVYRDAGGVLPEDEDKSNFFVRTLRCIVKHPLFKVFKILMFIKKIFTCITSGGAALLKNCCHALFWTPPSIPDAGGINVNTGLGQQQMTRSGNVIAPEPTPVPVTTTVIGPNGEVTTTTSSSGTGTEIGMPTGAETDPNRVALYRAAEHMSDPQVQAHMQDMLRTDPQGLDEMIQNDPELRALRDSNPLCAELMSDPETMKVLTNPDNLRALADAPGLIEQDFSNPNWDPPRLEEPPIDIDDDDEDYDLDNDGVLSPEEQAAAAARGNGTDQFDATNPEDASALEDFGLEDSVHDTNVNNNSSIYITPGAYDGNNLTTYDEANDASALEEFELGESQNQNVSYNPTGVNTEDGGTALEDFELHDSNNIAQQENSAYLEDFELQDTNDNINTVQQENSAYLEDFELGDANDTNVVQQQENSALEDFELDDTADNNVQENSTLVEDFELHDTQEAGPTATDVTDIDDVDTGDAIAEDFALKEIDDTNGPTSGSGDVDGTAVDTGDSPNAMEALPPSQQQQQQQARRPEDGPRSAAGITSIVSGGIVAQVMGGLTDIAIGEGIDNAFNQLSGDWMENGVDGGGANNLDKALEAADYLDEAGQAAENKGTEGQPGTGGAEAGGAAARGVEGVVNENAAPVGIMGRLTSVIGSAAKEAILGQFVGEDFAEIIADRQESRRGLGSASDLPTDTTDATTTSTTDAVNTSNTGTSADTNNMTSENDAPGSDSKY